MQGVILVGGEGTRLRPLTYGTPKAMVPILGRPFLEHMLVYLRGHGIDEIFLALGHQPDAIRAYFGDGSHWHLRLHTAVESAPLGSAGAIKQFAAALTAPFFAFNGDILTDANLSAMQNRHVDSCAALSIFFTEVEDPSAFGVAALNREGRVLQFVEKPLQAEAPSHWANAGAWLFQPEVTARIPAGRRSMVETELFPQLIAAGERVQAYCERGFWVDIGSLERYRDVQLSLLAGEVPRTLPLALWPGTDILCSEGQPAAADPPRIAPGARISGPVLLGAGVEIAAEAHVDGPVAIGAYSRIGAASVISRSILWDRCQVDPGAQISNSVLASGARVGSAAALVDVFAGHGASIEPGAVAQDVRIDPDVIYGDPRQK